MVSCHFSLEQQSPNKQAPPWSFCFPKPFCSKPNFQQSGLLYFIIDHYDWSFPESKAMKQVPNKQSVLKYCIADLHLRNSAMKCLRLNLSLINFYFQHKYPFPSFSLQASLEIVHIFSLNDHNSPSVTNSGNASLLFTLRAIILGEQIILQHGHYSKGSPKDDLQLQLQTHLAECKSK